MPLDLATLDVTEGVTIPEPRRGKTPTDNPAIPKLEQSRDNGNANLAYPPIPATDVRKVANYLRYGAMKLGIGVRVYMTATDGREVALGTQEKNQPDIIYKGTNDAYTGDVTIAFRAQKRRERKPTATNGDSADNTDITDGDSTDNADNTDGAETTSDTDDANTSDDTGSETVAETVDATPVRRGRRR